MKIFISYSSIDRPIVEKLTNDLVKMGHVVWYDQIITGGRKWWTDICDEILNCDLFIATVSANYLNSKPCTVEGNYADQLKKRIFPIKIDTTIISDAPLYIQKIQFIVYDTNNRNSLLDLFAALVRLPDPSPLPSILPPVPRQPISRLENILKELEITEMGFNQQIAVFDKLQTAYENIDTQEEAINLLRKFQDREDLYAKIDRQINQLMKISLREQQNSVSTSKRTIEVIKSVIGMAISKVQNWHINIFNIIAELYHTEDGEERIYLEVSADLGTSLSYDLNEELLIRQWDINSNVVSKEFLVNPGSEAFLSALIANEIIIIAQHAGVVILATEIKKIPQKYQDADDIPF